MPACSMSRSDQLCLPPGCRLQPIPSYSVPSDSPFGPVPSGPLSHPIPSPVLSLEIKVFGISNLCDGQPTHPPTYKSPLPHPDPQGKSGGLLEVTVLISGEHRKRNIPGAAFRRGAGKLLAKAGLVSPVMSSPADSTKAAVNTRWVGGWA